MGTALITGASSGLGLEFAKLFIAEGHSLVLVARSTSKMKEIAASLGKSNGALVLIISKDLSVPNSAREIFEELQKQNIEVEFLVNNAGFGNFGKFHETDISKEMEMIQVNVASLTELSKRFLPPMVKRGKGRILNVASTAAFQPGPLMAVYYATKAYVLSLSEAIAAELEGTGVTITALCPGPTATGFQKGADMEGSKLFARGKVMDAVEVAKIGFEAMMCGKRISIAGFQNKVIAQSVRFLPRKLVTKIVEKVQAK